MAARDWRGAPRVRGCVLTRRRGPSPQPRWTSYASKWYGLMLSVHANPTAVSEWDDLRRLHSTSGEPAMAGGEASTAANTSTVFWTVLIETEYTYMIYRRSQTQWGANRGWGTRRSDVPRRCHGRVRLVLADTMF